MEIPKAILILHAKETPQAIRLKLETMPSDHFVIPEMPRADGDVRFYRWIDEGGLQMVIEYDRATCPIGECIVLETVIEPDHIKVLEELARHFGGFLNRGDGKFEEILAIKI